MDVVEHVAERRRPELAERVAQVHAALAPAAKAEPPAQALGREHALVADRVLRDRLAELLGAREVRPRAAAREPVGVVRVEQQAADAGLELAADRALLQRREPARERDRHGVVRGRERDRVERPVAQVGAAVAARDLRRCGRIGAAGGDEPGTQRRHDERRRDGHGDRREPPARAHARGTDAGGAADQPEDGLHALVEHVDPGEPGPEEQGGLGPGDHQSARGDEDGRAGDPRSHMLRLGAEPAPGGAQRPLDPDGLDDRRRGRGEHRTHCGHQPAGRAQVAEEGVPHRGRHRGVVAGTVHHDGSGQQLHGHDDDARDDRGDPDARRGAATIRADRHGGERRAQRQRRQHERQHPHIPRLPREVAGRRAEVAAEQLQPLVRLHPGGELRVELADGGRHDDPDVRQRHRHGVAVALEHRAVGVAHRAAEQPRERVAADRSAHRRRDQRPGGEQVGLAGQDELVGDPVADRLAHRGRLQRGRGPFGEPVGVEQRSRGVRGERGRDQEQTRRDQQDLRRHLAGCGGHDRRAQAGSNSSAVTTGRDSGAGWS